MSVSAVSFSIKRPSETDGNSGETERGVVDQKSKQNQKTRFCESVCLVDGSAHQSHTELGSGHSNQVSVSTVKTLRYRFDCSNCSKKDIPKTSE